MLILAFEQFLQGKPWMQDQHLGKKGNFEQNSKSIYSIPYKHTINTPFLNIIDEYTLCDHFIDWNIQVVCHGTKDWEDDQTSKRAGDGI